MSLKKNGTWNKNQILQGKVSSSYDCSGAQNEGVFPAISSVDQNPLSKADISLHSQWI